LHVGCNYIGYTYNWILYFISFVFYSKCSHYISKCICLVLKPSTKCHLGWGNERGWTLKAKPKHQIGLFKTCLPSLRLPSYVPKPMTWVASYLLTYLPTYDLPTYQINYKINNQWSFSNCHMSPHNWPSQWTHVKIRLTFYWMAEILLII